MDILPLHRRVSSCKPKWILTPWTSHTWVQSLFITASPHERQKGFPLSGFAHYPHVAADREPHTWMHSLFTAMSLRACPKGSPLPVLHTPGCTPSSSQCLRACPKGSPLPILAHSSHVPPARDPPTHIWMHCLFIPHVSSCTPKRISTLPICSTFCTTRRVSATGCPT